METRCVIHRWSLFSVAFVMVTAATVVAPAITAAPRAQSTASEQTPVGTTPPAGQESIPPDHYDPDNKKIWPDVLAEDLPVQIRQQQFTVHFYRSRNDGPGIPAIYACGDGGWRGFARTAQQLAHMGFAVAGIDSKISLRDFSSVKTPLSIKQVASDYADVAKALRRYARLDSGTPVYVYGWSLGAGFAVCVGADVATRATGLESFDRITKTKPTRKWCQRKPCEPEDRR